MAKQFIIGSGLANAVNVSLDGDLFVIAGPCIIESEQICLDIAKRLRDISQNTGVKIIFKASFDKANRSSIDSFRGPGLEKGLEILAKVREQTKLPIVTDIHEANQAAPAAEVVDCLQVPAFLCRQTDLLCACAETGKPINVKKGQFMSPQEMDNVVNKIRASGNDQIMLTERGTFFGYNRLVNDMTALSIMKKLGCPVIFDVTHSTQQPGGLGNASAGSREMAPVLAKAAVAAGANGLFFEVHPEPAKAKSDAACIMPIDWLKDVLKTCKQIFDIVR
ncbi:MAG: 3-deoxy-8-phosphooctulonate synthase [Phycisphaerae bacterium]|nr:3-deoxy-8-phosphooctulonate synthase [Phycisphaerae bacterium]